MNNLPISSPNPLMREDSESQRVNSISLILRMGFDLLHICLPRCNALKQNEFQNTSSFYCNFLDFLNQWIKLLLSWSMLCNDCLKTMTYVYIYIYILSLKAFLFPNFKIP
jgi:hypothetical protein